MRIKNVDFPTPLLEAQQDGSLVLFVGAGVSMPPPSNFPNFDSLAEQVAAGVLTREQYGEQREPVDHFLGRVKDAGVKVQGLRCRITLRIENTARATQLTMATVYAFQLGSGGGGYGRIFRRGSLLWYVPETASGWGMLCKLRRLTCSMLWSFCSSSFAGPRRRLSNRRR